MGEVSLTSSVSGPSRCSTGRITGTSRRPLSRCPGVPVVDSDRTIHQACRLCWGEFWEDVSQGASMAFLSVAPLRLRLVAFSAGFHIVDGSQRLAVAGHLCTDLPMLEWCEC